MLKIKSNTNEFTIIFSEKIGKKKNAQKISFSLCSVQHPFFFSPSFLLVSASFSFFLLLFSAASFEEVQCLFLEKFIASFFFFSAHVCLFSQPKNIFFQPKTFLPQPKILFQFSPKILFSAQNVFALAQDTFSVQPKNLSLFVVQRLLLFVSFLPAFLFCL